MTREAEVPGSSLLWRAASVAPLAAGGFLLATGRGTVSGAVLLLIAGLATTGVLLGAGRYGPESEGVLDLSARVGLGLLGGLLGGLAVAVARWVVSSTGIDAAVGVDLPSVWTGAAMLSHLGAASVWGMVLGILYPHIPGVSPGSRGMRFSLVVSLYMLLKVYPIDLDAGWFGAGFGALTFLFVIVLNGLWGSVTGNAIGWGETDDEAPVARGIAE